MLGSNLTDAFGTFVKNEESRAARFTNDLVEGTDSPSVQALKRQWRKDALSRYSEWAEQNSALSANAYEISRLADERKELKAAMDMQWLLTQVAKHLVNCGSVPPAWDNNTKPPSFDHVLLFLDSADQSQFPAPLDDPHLLRELRSADMKSLFALDWHFPPEIGGRMQLMCANGFDNVSALEKALCFIGYEDVDIVPYSACPTGNSSITLDDAVSKATAAERQIGEIEDEIVALVTKDPEDSKIEDLKRRLSEAKDVQASLYSDVLQLCQASLAGAKQEPLRPFLSAHFLLSRVAQTFVGLGLVPCHWDEDLKGPIFEHVLQALNSNDPGAESAENRENLRATFTESEWQFFTALNNECFNVLFNSEPPRVHGYLQLSSEVNCVCCEETLKKVAKTLEQDFSIASAHFHGSVTSPPKKRAMRKRAMRKRAMHTNRFRKVPSKRSSARLILPASWAVWIFKNFKTTTMQTTPLNNLSTPTQIISSRINAI